MANVRHSGRKRKITNDETARPYQKRASKKVKNMQKDLKDLQQTPPNHLDANAKRLWRQLAPELVKIGNVKQLDCINLETLCSTYSIYLQAEKDFEKNGSYIESGKGGLLKNPAVSIVGECTRNIKTLCADLGISFNSRVVQNIPAENSNEDEKSTPLKLVNFNV